MITLTTIYQQLVTAGVEHEHHESDLYVPVNDVTTAIIAEYEYKKNVTKFVDFDSCDMWYDIPFAYDPWWQAAEKTAEIWAHGIKGE